MEWVGCVAGMVYVSATQQWMLVQVLLARAGGVVEVEDGDGHGDGHGENGGGRRRDDQTNKAQLTGKMARRDVGGDLG